MVLYQPASKEIAVANGIIPREYQRHDHDESFRLWDEGERGVLTRIFTGGGKTLCACLKAATWLNRGPDYRVMVVSYEKQLVWQFAQEIEDFLGITPGIEMDSERVDPDNVPRVVVASRQSLLVPPPPEREMVDELASYGIIGVETFPKVRCKRYVKHFRKGGDPDAVREDMEKFLAAPEVLDRVYSRVHKFDWRLNWLVVYDEAHRHSYRLVSCRHLVDWFDQNPNSRRSGLSATPKRSDGVSIGHKMFPGVAIDYPLVHVSKPNAVADGYAVPYLQRYIEVAGVDFKQLKKIAGDFDDAELETMLGEESTLASLVQPLLDMVEDRKTLIFSPGVEMAKNVAMFINTRRKTWCPACNAVKWYPRSLIGDGARCGCGREIEPLDIVGDREEAKALWGQIGPTDRRKVYRGHQAGEFQFLSVCGLCREGYNDQSISCVAVFRPVSKKASSLAEQMKGRGCRVLPKTVDGLETREERLAAIAASKKPNCIAEGTLVLTDHGEVPIERVTTAMKVWDGVEFVTHCGIICRGRQQVITYAGLTATPDHKVLIHDETNSASEIETWAAFGDAATKQIAIRVTGIGGKEVRETDGYYRRGHPGEGPSKAVGTVPVRRRGSKGLYGGHYRDGRLPEMRPTETGFPLALQTGAVGRAAVRESERQRFRKIRGPWCQVPVSISVGDGFVGSGESWASQGTRIGPNPERWPLRAWEPSVCDQDSKSGEHKEASQECRDTRFQIGTSGSQVFGCDIGEANRQAVLGGDRQPLPLPIKKTKRRVWDILNAGPRHRFTASGLLVSNCLIIDLVGITGLGDCASTVQIYADGLPDEVVERTEGLLAAKGLEEAVGVEEAIEEAKRQLADEREKAKQERLREEREARERAEKRSRADAEVRYNAQEVGHGASVDPDMATEKQMKYIAFLGMEIRVQLNRRRAGRIIGLLKARMPLEEVAKHNRIPAESWSPVGPSDAQISLMGRRGIPAEKARSKYDASQLIDATMDGEAYCHKKLGEIKAASGMLELDGAAHDVCLVRAVIDGDLWKLLVRAGRERREDLQGRGDAWE